MNGKSIEFENLQDNTFGILEETDDLLKEKVKKEIDEQKIKKKL